MSIVQNFIDNLTPSNYFITKSMEISKVTYSGTLWYTKKYLVLYDAIFLSGKIKTRDGILEIKNNFENYISTLPESQREDADKFFFPEYANLRGNCKTYNEFKGIIGLEENEKHYLSLVDKYYFVYLMGTGGQGGVNEYIKQKLYQDDFVVSNLENIIREYERYNPEKHYTDRDITRIINDYHANLRNERKILFYYGFFHSRNISDDSEFASLTPIGELAVQSNSKEFNMIWEHQKIKMISQPVTIDLPSIKGCTFCDVDKFKLNYSPYISILNCILHNNGLVPRFYDYVLSRTNNGNISDIIEHYDELKAELNAIKTKIENFGIPSDKNDEDFRKEMLKYSLGLRDDLHLDKGDNYFGCISISVNNSWKLNNVDRLKKIVSIYNQIEEYKIKRYNSLFSECENELKRKYKAYYSGTNYNMNHRIKMSWDLFNIKKEKIILLSLVLSDYIMYKNIKLSDIDYNDLYDYCSINFYRVLKSVNLSRKRDIINSLKVICDRIRNCTLKDIDYEEDYNIETVYVNQYSTLNTDDIYRKLVEVSYQNIQPTLERKRDPRVIDLLKALYLAENSDENHLIACECCGQKTFVKQNDEPYLEYHHLIPFSIADGPDHFENIFGICPMCHRKIHYGKDTLKADLYNGFNINNHLHKNILDRLKDLYNLNILKSYQLEYALSEQMIDESEYKLIVA